MFPTPRTCTRLYPIHQIQGPAQGFFTARPNGPEPEENALKKMAENQWATGAFAPLPGGPLQLIHVVITPISRGYNPIYLSLVEVTNTR